MALVYKDRVKQVCTAPTTTDPFDFTGAATTTGYQTFVAALADGETCIYAAEDADGDWEVGLGTWTEASDQLARTTILASSNAGSAETFSGDTTVYITISATAMETVNDIANRVVMSVYGTGATNQSLTISTWTKITTALNATPSVDTISGWDGVNKKYVPNVAGKYLISGQVKAASITSGKFTICGIYKNGSEVVSGARNFNASGSSADQESGIATAVIELNGSTDYIELYGYISEAKNISAHAATYLLAIYLGI